MTTLYSMTAFARVEHTTPHGTLMCELKSVNHRHLELSINLNDALRPYEMDVREQLRKELQRGKVDCWMRFQHTLDDSPSLQINQPVLQSLLNFCDELGSRLPVNSLSISLTDLLNWPTLLKQPALQSEVMQEVIEHTVTQALQEFLATRGREGQALYALIQQRLNQLHVELDKVSQRIPLILTQYKERLQQKLAEYQPALNHDRLEQEMILFMHKMDIHEETDRLRTHINEMERVFKQGGSVGRRCDFLLQELNREANTIGSKTQDALIAHACVEMKVIIEQIREQVQNLE